MTRRALLRDRALLALLARDVVSTAGSQMTWVALPWFVVTTTGSATKMAIVVAVEAAALGIVGFAAGNLVGSPRAPAHDARGRRLPRAAHRGGSPAVCRWTALISAAAGSGLCRRCVRHAVVRLQGSDPARDRRRGRGRARRGKRTTAGGNAHRAGTRSGARRRPHRGRRSDERPLHRRGHVRWWPSC